MNVKNGKNMDEIMGKIKELEKDLTDARKNNSEKSFIEEMLSDASNLNFSKILNILWIILGSLSPILPLVFLYNKDLTEQMELLKLLIISITINWTILIIVMMLKELDEFLDKNNLNLKIKKKILYAQVLSHRNLKRTFIINDLEKQIRSESIKKSKRNRIVKKTKKIINKVDSNSKKIEELRNRIDVMVKNYKNKYDESKSTDKNNRMHYSVIYNTMAGGLILSIKLIDYFSISAFNFDLAIKILGIFYLILVVNMFSNILIYIVNSIFKYIYEGILSKYKINEYLRERQISFFDNYTN
ncbi:hypothetical protein QJR52_06690 [Clostridium baratii]|uniref:hypothetical protein n=1 Tax=Clostridium baratii TaxID=1561 RepID=UPI0030CFF949